MLDIFKNLILTLSFNAFLFLLLIIGIQNSSNKSKVNLLFNETVKLPISFVMGTSFICGSVAGSLLKLNFDNKKQ